MRTVAPRLKDRLEITVERDTGRSTRFRPFSFMFKTPPSSSRDDTGGNEPLNPRHFASLIPPSTPCSTPGLVLFLSPYGVPYVATLRALSCFISAAFTSLLSPGRAPYPLPFDFCFSSIARRRVAFLDQALSCSSIFRSF